VRWLWKILNGAPLPVGLKRLLVHPPGHYYSPLPSLQDVRNHEDRIFSTPDSLPGIDLNRDEQLRLFDDLKEYYHEVPFTEHRGEHLYYYDNGFYSYSDAIVLFCMMRHLRPQRIIEVGSGFSSRAMIDTNKLFFRGMIRHTIIDPYPDKSAGMDSANVTLLQERLQDADTALFSELGPNDILFVDSTHVAKIDSDVNALFFRILPALQPGVCIHFHDIMYPFEYPREWVYGGIAWNEAYFLRAFLQNNDHFRIIFFSTFLEHFYEEKFRSSMPLCLKNRGGSIWIRKLT
jgi:hypothetical protein